GVDDAPFSPALVQQALRSRFPGLQIEEAANGSTARQLLAPTSFDLILRGRELPEMRGLALLEWLRSQPGEPETPCLTVARRGDRDNVVQAIQAGVSDYVGKPFSNEQLISKVSKALHRVGKLELLRSRPVQTSAGHAQESVSALLGSRQSSAPATTARPGAGAQEDHREVQLRSPVRAQLRLAEVQLPCVIRRLSLRDAQLLVRRNERLPSL